jgi:hypothetical protein
VVIAMSDETDTQRQKLLTAEHAQFDRRSLLAAGGALGLGTLGIPLGAQGAFASTTSDPVSMAMHLHASFSEGIASMDAHLEQARRCGVDVVWWTDHDFRRTAHGYRQAIDFDGAHDPEGHWDLTWRPLKSGPVASANMSFASTPSNPNQSGDKMLVSATAGSGSSWSTYLLEARSQNVMYSTSYFDTTITLDVRPTAGGSDTRVVIDILSSYRPARSGRKAGQYRIQYRIGGPAGYSTEDGGRLGVVGLPAIALDTWKTITLDPRADHATLWPDTIADDASLYRLRLGVQARNGATAKAAFDRLQFRRGRDGSLDIQNRFEQIVDAYRSRFPAVTQFAASEISLVLHLNAFGGTGVLPTYSSSQAIKDSSLSAQRAMVDWLHGQGAVVALNHPLQGANGPDDLARRLITTRGQGADVIEIGTGRDPIRMGRVLDAASRNGVFLTANGTTDDHRGVDWLGGGRRWLTRVWSPTKRESDLCAALRAGRAWFYDPRRWDGLFDLHVGTTRMGHVRFTKRDRVDVTVRATDLPAGSSLRLIVGACDLAGPNHLDPANRMIAVPARKLRLGHWTATVRVGVGFYVRAVIILASGKVAGFSNPMWVLPEAKRDRVDVPASRR